jgi:succinylglutamate desuccinylase
VSTDAPPTPASALDGHWLPGTGGWRFPRVLGRIEGPESGPTLVVTCGIHGNEPAGLLAVPRILWWVQRHAMPIRGTLLILAGNRAALRANRRFLDRDLNRCWTADRVDPIRRGEAALEECVEAEELRELVDEIDRAAARAPGGKLTLVDLHTTSGDGPPFAVMSDTLRNRKLAFKLGLPVFLGLEESIDGTLLEWATEQGHTAVLVEGGRHDAPIAVEVHDAVIWSAMVATGLVTGSQIPDRGANRRLLLAEARGLPRVVELRYRQPVERGDGFVMEPGFVGFEPVHQDQVIARNVNGDVRAPGKGLIVMPLYQDQGSDGFFLVRPVRRFWLRLSFVLRKLGGARFLPLLPGISRIPGRPHALAVDLRVAKYYAVEIFHLFGYRKRDQEADRIVFTRRRPG